jgi:hypothetical protein
MTSYLGGTTQSRRYLDAAHLVFVIAVQVCAPFHVIERPLNAEFNAQRFARLLRIFVRRELKRLLITSSSERSSLLILKSDAFSGFFCPRSCALAPFDGELRRGFWLKMRIFWL